jgi:hypothetical protein
VFEQSYLPFMLDTNSYDTICHEHLEYYSLRQIKQMTDAAGLKIVDIEFNDVNGGSFSVAAAKRSAPYPEARKLIEETLQKEQELKLSDRGTYLRFAQTSAEHRAALVAFLTKLKQDGKKVLGYGASTKGNVLIQYCNLSPELVPCIAEVNQDKFGAFTPGSRIPIVSEAEARAMKPDYFIVLPWHFRAGIVKREAEFLNGGGKFIFPLPHIDVVSKDRTETVWGRAG